jgi:hypothetical protein
MQHTRENLINLFEISDSAKSTILAVGHAGSLIPALARQARRPQNL